MPLSPSPTVIHFFSSFSFLSSPAGPPLLLPPSPILLWHALLPVHDFIIATPGFPVDRLSGKLPLYLSTEKMDAPIEVSLDKLPIKRLDAIEENGYERFPSAVGYDEKSVNLIRRIDFAWAVEREEPSKKQKKEGASSAKEDTTSNRQSWEWQSIAENLHLAQEELRVIIDLIETVEANDAVTVAVNTQKQLPGEILTDLAVSTATKLQCYRHLGKYFKQSAKALEEQITRESRFYGALIRLQQNWKVKRHRLVAAASGNEGFYLDLFDNSLDLAVPFRPSSMSTIPVEHDTTGMLSVNLPRNSCHTLQFDFLGLGSAHNRRVSGKARTRSLTDDSDKEAEQELVGDGESVGEIHLTLREVHRAIHDEQVFELVSREACNPSLGVTLTGIRENYLRLNISQGPSVSISLVPSHEDNQEVDGADTDPMETSYLPLASLDGSDFSEVLAKAKKFGIPSQASFEIYLQQLFHQHVFVKAKNKANSSRDQISGQSVKDNSSILGHFCTSLSHRIFANKVLTVLENLVRRTPYVHLVSHPSWHSRSSSWTLSMRVPQSILHAQTSEFGNAEKVRSQLWTKVVVIDDSVKVEGEGAPNVGSLFKGKTEGIYSVNGYACDLADLPIILLQQVAGQIIQWLHEEALTVGIKTTRDFLSLAFELEQGEVVRLAAHVDPEDPEGCISWWLVLDDGFDAEENMLRSNLSNGEDESRKFLGYPSLDQLQSALLDFLNLRSC